MNKPLLLSVAAVAMLSLGACKPKTQVVDTEAPDPMASQLANAAPVELPPSIKATVTFRCKDNSLVDVDFFHGDKRANLRMKQGGNSIVLTADKAGDPLTGSGYSLTGDQSNITLATPDKGTLTCKH